MVLQVSRPSGGASGLQKAQSAAQIGMGVGRLFAGDPTGAMQVAGGAHGLQGQGPSPQQAPTDSAVKRRLTGGGDPMAHVPILQEAERAVQALPPDARAEVLPPLFQTMARVAQQIKSSQGFTAPSAPVPGAERIQ